MEVDVDDDKDEPVAKIGHLRTREFACKEQSVFSND